MTLANGWQNSLERVKWIAHLANPTLAKSELRLLRQPVIFIVNRWHCRGTRLQVSVTKFNHVTRHLHRRLADLGVRQNETEIGQTVSEIPEVESSVVSRIVTVPTH